MASLNWILRGWFLPSLFSLTLFHMKRRFTIYSKTALYTTLYELLFSVSTCKFWARELPTYNWCVINNVCVLGLQKLNFKQNPFLVLP